MAAFATTRWTLIARAKGDSAEARDALAELCRAYWSPVYAFVRRSHEPTAALDLTQGFFVHLLEQGLVDRADRSRGRFRSFLRVAIRRYLGGERDIAAAQRRGGHALLLSLDVEGIEERCVATASDGETPERQYERAWAENVLARAMERLRLEHHASGKADRFETLRGLLTETTASRHAAVGQKIGLSAGAVKVAVHRLRQRYLELLRAEVADTVTNDEDVEAELRELLRALERA